MLDHHFRGRQPATREDLGDDELDEARRLEDEESIRRATGGGQVVIRRERGGFKLLGLEPRLERAIGVIYRHVDLSKANEKMGVTVTPVYAGKYKTMASEDAPLSDEARADIQVCDELLPDSPPDKLLILLNSLPGDACVICVGHEPHQGDAAGLMLFGEPVPGLSLKKAGACAISFEAAPRAGRGTLRWWLTPAQLRALGER